MSWDVIIFNVSNEIKSVSELTEDAIKPLGSRDNVLSAIKTTFPQANLSDPSWVVQDGAGYSIEFSLGQNDPIQTMMVYVRGDISSLRAIEQFCRTTGWRAFDSSVGDFIDFSDLNYDRGFKRWEQYKNYVASKHSQNEDE